MRAEAEALDPKASGHAAHDLITRLYPLCRSITGDGVRDTLRILQREMPLTIEEVPTGTPVYDWVVPPEWNIRDAYIKDRHGRRVVDFRQSNLHVVSYSEPVHTILPLSELRAHLFTSPEHPEWIPYRTSYYKPMWGFCLSQRHLEQLPEGDYEVCIDSTLTKGSLTYGEVLLEGAQSEEVLLSCHVCHPSLCNDNLSGIAVAAQLYHWLAGRRRRYSYRMLFIPGTIGSITWLSRNEHHVHRIRHGLVLACLGDPGPLTYKTSRRGRTEIDRAVSHVLKHSGDRFTVVDFSPYGYDERQYCSPGFDLPVGCLMRTPHGQFPQYHTSADDLTLVTREALGHSIGALRVVIQVLEDNRRYVNTNPKCEPRLGKRGLYRAMGGGSKRDNELALLWVLNLSDGMHSLLDIAERADLPFPHLEGAARALLRHHLLEIGQ